MMDAQEANKIIAEYMGLTVYRGKRGSHKIVTSVSLGRVNGSVVSDLYSESLDSLVPVWEKLKLFEKGYGFKIYEYNKKGWYCCFQKYDGQIFMMINHFIVIERKSIQEAAAIATAKAIEQLTEGEGE
jgi:hypothetical protein